QTPSGKHRKEDSGGTNWSFSPATERKPNPPAVVRFFSFHALRRDVTKGPPATILSICRFQKSAAPALLRPLLGVPNSTTCDTRLHRSSWVTSACCSTKPPMLCATSARVSYFFAA